jgi:tetratricopeptide (TPR) repeat protein
VISTVYLAESNKSKRIALADNYIEAKVYLANNDKEKAKSILEKIIFSNDSTYSTLSLFLYLNENLTTDQEKLVGLFNQVLENNKFEKEVKDLVIFKKALIQSNFVNESKLLETVNPIIKEETIWKPHALLLVGDYYASNKEYLKAKEFYKQILSIKNLHKNLYLHAQSQLLSIK